MTSKMAAKSPSQPQDRQDVLSLQGILIPDNREVISEQIRNSIQRGRYEIGEINAAVALATTDDKILELGAGLGAVAAAVCSQVKPKSYVAVEAHPELLPVIKETWALNGVKTAELRHGLAVVGGKGHRDFYIRDSFWASSMEPDSREYTRVEKIPEIDIVKLVKTYKPTMLIADIEGGEEGLFEHLNLSSVEKIILELHPKIYGAGGVARIMRTLMDAGFLAEPINKSTTVRIFSRAAMTALETPSTAGSNASDDKGDLVGPKVMIATCMKNEGPFILEWIAWNKAIGVQDIVVFTNDCTDGSDLLLDRLDELGEVIHLPNPAPLAESSAFQPIALAYAVQMPAYRRNDYFFSCDVDEFLNIRIADGSLRALFAAAGSFDALSISEINHGCNQREEFEPGWLTEQFPRHDTEYPVRRKSHRGVKTIVKRTRKITKVRNHRPDFKERALGRVMWRDGSGTPVQDLKDDPDANGMSCQGRYTLASLNHYALRSLDDYISKVFRGDVVRKNHSVSTRYWRIRNKNTDETSVPQRAMARAKREYERMMQDENLAALQQNCFELYTKAIEERKELAADTERRKEVKQISW